jgi:hypothetical protein
MAAAERRIFQGGLNDNIAKPIVDTIAKWDLAGGFSLANPTFCSIAPPVNEMLSKTENHKI